MVKVFSVNDPDTGIERAIFFNEKTKKFLLGSFAHLSYDPANPESMDSLVNLFSRTHSNRQFLTQRALANLKWLLLGIAKSPNPTKYRLSV